MLACIPTKGNAGLQDAVSDHFGSTPFFTLCDTDTNEVTVVENRNAHHDHGTCHPMNQLAKHKIDCVVCGGMGRRAVEALSTEGVKVYLAKSATVQEIVEKIKAGDLAEIDPAKACRGHGQQGGGCAHVTATLPETGRGSGHGQGPGRGLGAKRGKGQPD